MKIMNFYDCDWYKSNGKSKLNEGAARMCDFTVSEEFAWINELTQDINDESPRALVSSS